MAAVVVSWPLLFTIQQQIIQLRIKVNHVSHILSNSTHVDSNTIITEILHSSYGVEGGLTVLLLSITKRSVQATDGAARRADKHDTVA